MKKMLAAFLVSSALIAPALTAEAAQARPVQIEAKLQNYGGPGAYVAVYLAKPNGAYHSTIAIAGGKEKYYPSLRGWYRGISRSGGRVDGVTGASVGSGRSLSVTAEIADALIAAGYQIKVDTAVEDRGEVAADATVKLDGANASYQSSGRGFVKSLYVDM